MEFAGMNVCILNSQSSEWKSLLPASISVFGSLEYARIYEEHTGHSARLFVAQSDDGLIAYPFFLRPIQSLPFAQGVTTAQWDTLTPEYTGPLCRGECSPELIAFFTNEFSTFCKEERIVAEFAHLHPWNALKHALQTKDIVCDREIVFMDLTRTEDQIWSLLESSCRNKVSQARRREVSVIRASTLEDVQEFHRIYILTMQRNNALKRYYFPLEFFGKFWYNLPNNATFFLARHHGCNVSASLCLHDEDDAHYYLTGTDGAFHHLRPNNAIVYEMALWAKGMEKKRLILGGGYKPNDGIFQFKASFSPLRAQFYVYRHVHLPEEYAKLCKAWSTYYKIDTANYFPLYRYIPETEERFDTNSNVLP